MTKLELLKRLAENHNRVSSMLVKSENAILAGDTIKDLRMLIEQIQNEGIQDENPQIGCQKTSDKQEDEKATAQDEK